MQHTEKAKVHKKREREEPVLRKESTREKRRKR